MTAPSPVDWEFAERVAHRVTGHDPLADSYHRSSLETDFAEVTRRSADLVADFTGLQPAVEQATGTVVDRRQWATLNLAAFRGILAPVTDRFAERIGDNPLTAVGRRIAGAEAGALLGWFGRRVLGQYDLFGGDGSGSVYYVGPNVLQLEKRHGFEPRAFRMWIALHEVTHLVQFTGVPWMRGHFLEMVDQSLASFDPDPARFARALRHALEEVRAGRNPLEGGGIMNLLATEEQREVLGRIQSLMSLLEGHGNYVMDRLGEEHVPGKDHMAQVLRERRVSHGIGRQVQKAVGLDLKMRQYSTGEQFFDAVERLAGREALAELWTGPGSLPTMDELREPDRWLSRTGAAA